MPNIIITGGPGSGKSTLLEALSKKSYDCVPEVSRILIREQVLIKSNCLPWKDLPCFARLALAKMTSDYESAGQQDITFFDRGIPDIAAYLKASGLSMMHELAEAVKQYQYARFVFAAPPWEAIYVNDDERWQTFDEACILYRAIVSVYSSLGYTMIELPCLSVPERVEFVLETIKMGNFNALSGQDIKTITLQSTKSC